MDILYILERAIEAENRAEMAMREARRAQHEARDIWNEVYELLEVTHKKYCKWGSGGYRGSKLESLMNQKMANSIVEIDQ